MFNKKSMGLHWFMLLIGLFMAIGILMYSTIQYKLPQVGEYSFSMLRTFEKNSRVPVIIEEIGEGINENTIRNFDNNKVFGLKSSCDPELAYINKIKETFEDVNGKLGISGKTRNCFIDEDDSMELFGEAFEKRLAFEFGNLNLEISNARYTSSVEKRSVEEGVEYFNTVNADVEIPIITDKVKNKKQIGKFSMNPKFELPVDYDFGSVNNEVCILSVDCGADCNDVRGAGYGGEIKEETCGYYNNCRSVIDDFRIPYPCPGATFSFCEGICCDDHDYDLKCGETTECGRQIGNFCDDNCPDTLCFQNDDMKCGVKNNCGLICGNRCDDGCPDADACGKCDNEACPPPEEEEGNGGEGIGIY